MSSLKINCAAQSCLALLEVHAHAKGSHLPLHGQDRSWEPSTGEPGSYPLVGRDDRRAWRRMIDIGNLWAHHPQGVCPPSGSDGSAIGPWYLADDGKRQPRKVACWKRQLKRPCMRLLQLSREERTQQLRPLLEPRGVLPRLKDELVKAAALLRSDQEAAAAHREGLDREAELGSARHPQIVIDSSSEAETQAHGSSNTTSSESGFSRFARCLSSPDGRGDLGGDNPGPDERSGACGAGGCGAHGRVRSRVSLGIGRMTKKSLATMKRGFKQIVHQGFLRLRRSRLHEALSIDFNEVHEVLGASEFNLKMDIIEGIKEPFVCEAYEDSTFA